MAISPTILDSLNPGDTATVSPGLKKAGDYSRDERVLLRTRFA
jgi:hypothetical protein